MPRPILLVGITLFVTLSACNLTKDQRASLNRFHLDLATTVGKNVDGVIEECSLIVVIAHGNNAVTINEESLQLHALNSRLLEILKYRSEKLVFIGADPDVSMQDFIEIAYAVYSEADVTSIVTSRVAKRERCLIPSCGRCEEFRQDR